MRHPVGTRCTANTDAVCRWYWCPVEKHRVTPVMCRRKHVFRLVEITENRVNNKECCCRSIPTFFVRPLLIIASTATAFKRNRVLQVKIYGRCPLMKTMGKLASCSLYKVIHIEIEFLISECRI